MQLMDAVFSIDQMDEDSAICAKEPFVWGSEATIVRLDEEGGVPEQTRSNGFTFFLDREDVAHLLSMISRKSASDRTKVEFLCHFAVADAYPSWIEDIPDLQSD